MRVNNRTEVTRAAEAENPSGDTEFFRKLKKVDELPALLANIQAAQTDLERIRRAWQCFRSGAYKDWND